MFTGIVEELGSVVSIAPDRVRVAATTVLEDATTGDSIAVDGCCLTLVDQGDGWWDADVSDETLKRTTLGDRQPGDRVNLERPVRAQDRLGGHIVQGHVDGVGEIVDPALDLRVRMPASCSATWSRRGRSRSTASASPSSTCSTTASPSRSSPIRRP